MNGGVKGGGERLIAHLEDVVVIVQQKHPPLP
jgi:hypothetical protein